MQAYYGDHSILKAELKDIAIADLVLTLSFTFLFVGGLAGAVAAPSKFLVMVPIAFVAVTLSFVLHEYMHKLAAQHFGAVAGFRKSTIGVLITLVTGFFGFLIGIPGATMIYASHFTTREEGIVSLAGPLTNFVVFLAFFAINITVASQLPSKSYWELMISYIMLISVILAFFNMLPIYPLDGSKVLRWNKPVYFSVVAVIFVLMLTIFPLANLIFDMVIWMVLALMFYVLYKGIRLF